VKAAEPAAVDLLDSSLDNLQGVARSTVDAASSAVSNSGGRKEENELANKDLSYRRGDALEDTAYFGQWGLGGLGVDWFPSLLRLVVELLIIAFRHGLLKNKK